LLEAGVKMGNPHDYKSGWWSLAYSPQRNEFYDAGDPQQICQYDAVLEKVVQHLNSQDLIEAPNDKGQTVINRACVFGSVGAVKALLDAGAVACTTSHDGTTPVCATLLHTCLWGSHIPEDWPTDRVVDWMSAKNKALLTMLDLLLNAGADADVGNGATLKPLGLAILAAWQLNSAPYLERLCSSCRS
jgi:ankyrin repeat protein